MHMCNLHWGLTTQAPMFFNICTPGFICKLQLPCRSPCTACTSHLLAPKAAEPGHLFEHAVATTQFHTAFLSSNLPEFQHIIAKNAGRVCWVGLVPLRGRELVDGQPACNVAIRVGPVGLHGEQEICQSIQYLDLQHAAARHWLP
jgi:hypothetical protein